MVNLKENEMEEFKNGDRVLVRDMEIQGWFEAVYIGKNQSSTKNDLPHVVCFNEFEIEVFKYCKHAPVKKFKKASEIIKWFEDNGYKYNDQFFRYETILNNGAISYFNLQMVFNIAGKEVDKCGDFESLPAKWIEEEK